MTFLTELQKKNYIQYSLAFILSGIFLYLTATLWYRPKIIISFSTEAVKNTSYKIFYTKEEWEPFSEQRSVKVQIKAGKQQVKVALPISKIVKFRLDIGNKPDKVILKNITIQGKHTFEPIIFPYLNNFSFSKDIDSYKVEENALILTSNKIDPYIVYNNNIDLHGKQTLDGNMLIILAVLSFLVFNKLICYLATFKLKSYDTWIDIVMLSVFFGMLWLPMSHISNAEKSEQENRILAPKIPLILQGEVNNNFGEQFNNWFSDRFFGRQQLLSLYDKIKYSLAPLSGNDKVLVGKNDWLFFKLDNSLDNFANKTVLSEDDLENGLKYLKDIDDWCKKNGKKFYYIIAPDKNKIYGEYYRLVKKQRDDTYSIGNQWANYIRQNSNIKVLYLYDILHQNKEKGLLYYKHDTHWTSLGAYYGYQSLMEMMGLPAKHYDFKNTKRKGDLEGMLSSAKKDETHYKDSKLEISTFCKTENDYTNCYNDKEKGSIIMFCDSFIDSTAFISYLSDSFNKITAYNRYRYPLTTENLEFIKNNFDIIILENIERHIPSLLNQIYTKD